MKTRIIDYNAITGFVDYGECDSEINGGYTAKMRCKKCGNAWLSANYVDGYFTCPKCEATGRTSVIAVE